MLYNPDITDLVFILPGLIALIMQIIVVTHSALSIVRERESGTLEQLLATPARPFEVIIGKLVPGMLVAILDMAVILAIGVFWFQVPFQGNILTLAGLAIIFIISGMGLGLVISAIAKTQRQAQQFTTRDPAPGHAADRVYLSAHHHAALDPDHRQPDPHDLFRAGHPRHHDQRRQPELPVDRYPDAGGVCQHRPGHCRSCVEEEIGLSAMPDEIVISAQELVKRFKGARRDGHGGGSVIAWK